MELSDTVVVITGAGSGIGRSLAHSFAVAGSRAVVCADLDAAGAEGTVAELAEAHPGVAADAITVDVGDERAVERLATETLERHGSLDVFVSNAGYGLQGGIELPTDEWAAMMNVHTWAHLAAARAVIPGMIERGGGYLLNTASAAGLLTQMDSGPYAVSKHAAVALAEWLSITYGDRGIGVSVLCPQAVRTNIIASARKRRGGVDRPQRDRDRDPADRQPRGRQAAGDGVLEPDEVAEDCIDAIRNERFLVLPHPEVATYFQRKAGDYDRWLNGMRRFRRKLVGDA
ncbi:MAG: SDR family NAD(P)-dependent oxidoreductase [Actinomycetota bacterium]